MMKKTALEVKNEIKISFGHGFMLIFRHGARRVAN